uniref:DNA-directed RNA polymerase n=1 Tax=Johnson-sea-linkia profunda TaxID=575876 RepID=A0A386AXT3_9CHLO|nr:RNA polymerase b-subunit [Johnson-sea-linkia profunda]
MKKTTSLDHLFKKPSVIFESGLSICNYQRFQKNFPILQKKDNFQRLRKNKKNKWRDFRPTKVHGLFFFNNEFCQNKNVFIQIQGFGTNDRKVQKVRRKSLPLTKKKSFRSKLSLKKINNIWFQLFEKSNQNTFFLQRPLSFPLQWIQKGDLLSDCSASHWGELALGQNLFVAYMPWEGFNFEDAVLINKKILSKYTSLHIQKYELEILENSSEQITITSQIPGIPKKHLQKLDKNGIIKIGSWVQENDILVGRILSTEQKQKKIPPLLMHEKLLYDLFGHETLPIQEKCLRVPLGCFGRILRIIYTQENQQNQQKQHQKSQQIKNIYRSSGRSLTTTSFSTVQSGFSVFEAPFFLKSFSRNFSKNLSFSSTNLILIKHRTVFSRWFWFYNVFIQKLKTNKFLLQLFFKKESGTKVGGTKVGGTKVGGTKVGGTKVPMFSIKQNFGKTLFLKNLQKVTIYIAEQREFQIGDKISGRHGNKGIISQICSNEDMPFCTNGCTLDILLNPLGVPSRMNVGQIFECLLGLTGQIFQTKFQVVCFDEIFGYEASRSFIYSKLLESCTKTGYQWLFSKKTPGKFHLFDGRTGQIFHQSVSIGSSYLMKLIHIVDEKIHARATGPYSLITQQPLRGRAKHGGQRVGEMEVWALQGFGSAYILQELLTVKSDDLQGRNQLMYTLLKNIPLRFGTPESFRVVLRELQCLCLDLQLTF